MAVSLTRHDEFALITLNRPKAMNALSFQIIRDIGVAIDAAVATDARGILFTGAGDKAFCAGADIRELRDRSLMEQKSGAELGQAIFAKLDTAPLPSFAVINGYAFGGGLELALACTFRLAASTASMGLPEIKLGLIPGYGGTQRLTRAIGAPKALELIMSGGTVTAQDALTLGLVHSVIQGDLMEGALSYARRITRFGLPALKFARDAVLRGAETDLHEGLRIEADLSTLAYQTSDAEEGMAAFEEKRKPVFRDA
ncbi:MAG: enoyl-CoA hydratase-related protein [Pseudomonadota bacterium]